MLLFATKNGVILFLLWVIATMALAKKWPYTCRVGGGAKELYFGSALLNRSFGLQSEIQLRQKSRAVVVLVGTLSHQPVAFLVQPHSRRARPASFDSPSTLHSANYCHFWQGERSASKSSCSHGCRGSRRETNVRGNGAAEEDPRQVSILQNESRPWRSPSSPTPVGEALLKGNNSQQRREESELSTNNEAGDDHGVTASQQYYADRYKSVQAVKEKGLNPYPHKFPASMTVGDFLQKFANLREGQRKDDVECFIAGRALRVASSGQKLRFYDLHADGHKVQVMANFKHHDDPDNPFPEVHDAVFRGDILGVRGFPGRSQRGELSLFARSVTVLSPCLRMLPPRCIKDVEVRYRQRYLDLLINEETRRTFGIRTQCIRFLRRFLEDRGFVEVETPMMSEVSGGATARPFQTFHNELHRKLFLRVAPELYHKMLVVGGFEKVFEIGKNFRNEGLDVSHSPEFTSCELYSAYTDYHDLMKLTEELLSGMLKSIKGSYVLTYHPDGPEGREVAIDFTPPFPRISMLDAIEKATATKLPRPLDGDECVQTMKQLLYKHNIEMPRPCTAAKLLDQLCGHFVESQIESRPAFIIEHPQIMSPLAKWHREKAELTERFELFVLGRELCNAYTELNDPKRQRECFQQQAQAIAAGDDEACPIDEGFCTALEYALPPTGGWGMGIDRLTMFLADKNNIKEVILFPALRSISKATVDETTSENDENGLEKVKD